jgi:hypothetical protein
MQGQAFYQGSEDDIKNHYGQAGLMVHFFLFGAKGKYRDKFMEYAKTVSHGDGREGLLAELALVKERVLVQEPVRERGFPPEADQPLAGVLARELELELELVPELVRVPALVSVRVSLKEDSRRAPCAAPARHSMQRRTLCT